MKKALALIWMLLPSCTADIPLQTSTRSGERDEGIFVEMEVDTTTTGYEFEIEVEYLKGGGNG